MSTNPDASTNSSTPSPFDHPDADIIIRSADGDDFRMFKIDLIRASPVFKDLLSLPQPPLGTNPEDYLDGLPVVQFPEPRDVLDIVLRWCMPPPNPPPLLDDIAALVVATRKYELEVLTAECHETLLKAADQQPVRVYAIGCMTDFEDIVRHAAKRCLRLPMSQIVDCIDRELDIISAHAFRRLVKYRLDCSRVALEFVTSWDTMGAPDCQWENNCVKCCGRLVIRSDRAGTSRQVHDWWDRYISKLIKDLEDNVYAAVRIEDALRLCIIGVPQSSCSYHPISSTVTQLTAFLAKLRTDLTARIQEVTLEYKSPRL